MNELMPFFPYVLNQAVCMGLIGGSIGSLIMGVTVNSKYYAWAAVWFFAALMYSGCFPLEPTP